MTTTRARLLAIVDGEAVSLTPEDAKAILAEAWDLRSDVGRLTAHYAAVDALRVALNEENNRLVAQLVELEQAAFKATLERDELLALVRAGLDGEHNPKRWRERAGEVVARRYGAT